jgi:hypothetical protein
MTSGLSNKLTGQIGEYLTCAELGKRGYIATSFTGNVPEFDLIVINPELKTIPIQVKTTRGISWPTKADSWINIEIDDSNKKQIDNGDINVNNPNLIYICVALSELDVGNRDRFFILRKYELQNIATANYRNYMNKHNWERPRNYKSLDNRYDIENLKVYENNWDLIKDEMLKL